MSNYYVHNREQARTIIAYELFRSGNPEGYLRQGDGFGREKCFSIVTEEGESTLTVIYIDD